MQPFTTLDAVAAPMPRANIDTDQIVPALYLQKPRADDFGRYLFHDVRRDADGAFRPEFVLNDPRYRNARVLVAGRNFGCGSSREHAVWALCDGGFRAVVAPSFGDIFHGNALKNGLLPVRLAQPVVNALLDELQSAPGTRLHIDLQAQQLSSPAGTVAGFDIDAFSRHCLLHGVDELDYTLAQADRIEAFERQLAAREEANLLP